MEIHEDLKIPEQRRDSAISAVWPEWSTVKCGIQVTNFTQQQAEIADNTLG